MSRILRPLACTWIVLSAGLAAPLGLAADDDLESRRAKAREAYADGRFEEALGLISAIDAQGGADGPLLYRLAYCQRTAGLTQESTKTEQRARTALEAELPGATTIEVPFYLANTYQNLSLGERLRSLAAETTDRVAQGQIAEPELRVGMFQLAKLYADQGLEEQASLWYERSLDASAGGSALRKSYRRWAAGYLGERAFRSGDFAAAQKHFTILASEPQTGVSELDRLAVASARVGKYAEAGAAWKRAESMPSPDPSRAKYCGRLAALAGELGSLPPLAPGGGPWSEVSKENLETLMKEQAAHVKEIFADAEKARGEDGRMPVEKRDELIAQLLEIKPVFVAAALEYALRGHSIREASFFGGYAPLVLRPAAWGPARNR